MSSQKNLFKSALGICLLIGLISAVDLKELIYSMNDADHALLLMAFILISSLCLFEGLRLKIVFACYSIRFAETMKMFFIGTFFSNFMPGAIGADIYQVFHVNLIKPGLAKPIALSLYLRFSGLIVNVVIAILTSLMLFDIDQVDFIFGVNHFGLFDHFGLILVILVSVILMYWLLSLTGVTRSLIESARRIRDELSGVVFALSIKNHTILFLLGLMVVFARAAGIYVLVIAFGGSIDTLEALLAVTVSTLTMLIPISFAGLGIREITMTAMLMKFGVLMPSAVAISVISRCFIWLYSIAGGVWFLATKPDSSS